MATTFWNQGEKEVSKGLDILGYRQVDQNVEKDWVSGVTTISFRARYFSLVPWLVAEYYERRGLGHDDVVVEPDYDELIALHRRLELVILACTRYADRLAATNTAGLIGPDLYGTEISSLEAGHAVHLDLHRGGASYGTYVAPCRSFGLLAHENLPGSWAPKLTPRTRGVRDLRRELAGDTHLAHVVLEGGTIGPEMIAAAADLFSASSLTDGRSEPEREFLETALFRPEATQDPKQYERFAQTVRLVLFAVREGLSASSDIIARTYTEAVQNATGSITDVRLVWATYELHRRVHFALELMLSAVTSIVIEHDGATVEQAIAEWMTDDMPAEIEDYIGLPGPRWLQPLGRFIDTVKDEPFLVGPVARSTGRQMPSPGAKAVFALALLCATWRQTRGLRANRSRLPGSQAGMCRAFPLIEEVLKEPLNTAVRTLTDRCVVEAHLNTTLRKMGHGLKCSLRFFPDGEVLRPTGIGARAGYSADRLSNVVGVLTDLGFIPRNGEDGLTARGTALLRELGGV